MLILIVCIFYGYPTFYAGNLQNNPDGENTNV